MSERLKPCPFCGGRPSIEPEECAYAFFVKCRDCTAEGPVGNGKANAAKAWNGRKPVTTRRALEIVLSRCKMDRATADVLRRHLGHATTPKTEAPSSNGAGHGNGQETEGDTE